MNDTATYPGTGITPAAHLIARLERMAAEASGTAEYQAAAAETGSPKWRPHNKQSAEFNCALAAIVNEALDWLRARETAKAFPGTTGSFWTDRDGDKWVMCDDGRLRLRPEGPGVEPDEVAHVHGPMTPAGGA